MCISRIGYFNHIFKCRQPYNDDGQDKTLFCLFLTANQFVERIAQSFVKQKFLKLLFH